MATTSLLPRARPFFTPLSTHVRALATVAESTVIPRTRSADGVVRRDWRRSEIQRIFDGPLMETVFRAVSRV